jgi:hypothetical protein
MAVNAPALAAAIMAAAPSLVGPAWFQLCTGLSVGITAWTAIPSNVVLTGVVSGTLGSGVVNGKLIIPPIPIPVVGSVVGIGLVGVSAPQIANAVGIGVGTVYTSLGQYIGVSVGAIGADVSKVVLANPATLTPLLISSLSAQGVVGPSAVQLCVGISPGIAAMFLTGTGTGISTGTATPTLGVGSSKSSIL